MVALAARAESTHIWTTVGGAKINRPRRAPSKGSSSRTHPRRAPGGPSALCSDRAGSSRVAPSAAALSRLARAYAPPARSVYAKLSFMGHVLMENRARTFESVVCADFWRSVSGRLRAAPRWIQLCKSFSFRPASIWSERRRCPPAPEPSQTPRFGFRVPWRSASVGVDLRSSGNVDFKRSP